MKLNKKGELKEKIQVRFKAEWKPNGESSLIFDTEQEAQNWISKLGDPSLIIEVKRVPGIVVNQSARVGLLIARNEKVWIPLEVYRSKESGAER